MLNFQEVNFEVKIRQYTGQICETIRNNDMSRLATFKTAFSKDIFSWVISCFIILMQYQNKYCCSKLLKKHTHTCDVNNRKVVITTLNLLLLNLILRYIFSRIPGKHKSTLKFFKFIQTDKKQCQKLFTTVTAKRSVKQNIMIKSI